MRVVGERGGELHPLLLAGRHRAERTEPLLAQPHLPQGVAGPGDGEAVGQPVDLGEVGHEIDGTHVTREVVVLGRVADEGAHLRPGPQRVEAEDADRAFVGSGQPEHESEQRRLAGPVGADEARDPSADLEGRAVERGDGTKALDDGVGRHDDCHRYEARDSAAS